MVTVVVDLFSEEEGDGCECLGSMKPSLLYTRSGEVWRKWIGPRSGYLSRVSRIFLIYFKTFFNKCVT